MATAITPRPRVRKSSDVVLPSARVKVWAAVCDGKVRRLFIERQVAEAYANRGNLINQPREPEYTVARVRWQG